MSALFAPTARHYLLEGMERIEDYIALGLGEEVALDLAADCILALAVELGEVLYRAVNLHVAHQHVCKGLHLLHRAGVKPLVVIAQQRAQFLLYVYIVFHLAKKCL